MKKGLDNFAGVLEHLIFENSEVDVLVLPILDQELIVDLKECVDFFESTANQEGDLIAVSFKQLVVNKPLVAIEVHLIGRLPLLADAVVPIFEDLLVSVKLGVTAPPLEYFEALHALEQALLDFHAEAFTIRLSFQPQTR